ncbi:endonuclease [Aureococcus anophagefferens]|nr:endonuclease [Aureococcus anophagefferens]
MVGAVTLALLVATHAAAFAPPRPTRAPLVARSYYKRPDAPPSPDGLSSLRSAAASGRWREALALIAAAEEAIGDRAAKGEGQAFPLPIEAYNLAITACGAAGEWREAGVLRRLTVGVDFDGDKGSVLGRRPRPDHVTFNAAGAAAAKSGRWRDAEMVLDQSRRYKRSHIILYTSVIGACGRAREKGRALGHLARLREERGRADVFAFTAAVDARARAGDFANATALRRAMEAEDRVAPNLRTFRALVSAAGNAGEWAAAEELRVEADVDARAVGGRDGDAFDFTLRGHVAAVGACAAFRGPAEGEDWADRRRVAFELLRRLEDRAEASLRIWRQLIDDGTAARPDGVSAAETVACLERGNRTADADEVFGDCLRLGVLLTKPAGPRSAAPPSGVKSSSFLDEDGEYDVSGMTVPLARCAVRRAVYEAAADLDPKATAKASVVFITGVGARRQFDPNHVPLRTHVLQLLRHGFDPPLVAFVPDDAPGTVK